VISGKKLLITGAFGFVGQSFIDWLEKQDLEFQPSKLILITSSPKNSKPCESKIDTEVIVSDLGKPWTFDVECDYLINLAADGSANAYSLEASDLFKRITNNMVSWLHKKEGVRFFHASSGACEGTKFVDGLNFSIQRQEMVDQKKRHLINSRIESESLILQNIDKLSIDGNIGRLFSFIGPRILNKSQYAVTSFLSQSQNSGVIKVTGNPNTVRSYLSSDDLSDWIYKTIQLDSKPKIMNFGSSVPVTINELANYIAKKTKSEVEFQDSNQPPDIYVAENKLTLDLLKVSEGRGWKEQIDDLIRFEEDKIR
jgi:nucleoside-diphosphate-sugar epimerase